MDAKALNVALNAAWDHLEAKTREVMEARAEHKQATVRLNDATVAHREAHEAYRRAKLRYEIASEEATHA